MAFYEPRCKVCTSDNKQTYEEFYCEREGKVTWSELEEKAKVLGEEISYRAFERHFKRHFSTATAELIDEEEISGVVKNARKEVINTVDEIRNNLNGLKALLNKSLEAYKEKAISPGMLRGLTELYREHRQSIEACEKLTGKLVEGTNLSEAEILRILYVFAKDLCPTCTQKFKVGLETYLGKKKHGLQD